MHTRVPENNIYWNCYLIFLEALDYILALESHIGQIYYLEEIISNFLELFGNLNNNSIKPKAHYMLYYATQYMIFRPLINYSTLRFEVRHSNLKSIF